MGLLKQTFQEWSEDQSPILAAALAYFAMFSIAPLLLVVIGILSLVIGENAAQSNVVEQVRSAVGPQAGDAIQSMLENANQQGGGLLATIIGFATLLLGATGVFAQLQKALNIIWGVKPDPEKSGIKHLIVVRLQSLGVVLLIGLLLIASLLVSTVLSGLGQTISDALPGGTWLWQGLNLVLSAAVITVLVAIVFKVLPDATVDWRDVWIGSAVTGVLFVIGNFLLGLYLGNSAVASTYGAAGSLVVLLLWIYFSALVLLFGGEFTQVYARRTGSRIEPAEHAVRREGFTR